LQTQYLQISTATNSLAKLTTCMWNKPFFS